MTCTSLLVVYLTDSLQLETLETSFFLNVLVISLFGFSIGANLNKKYHPNILYTLSILYLFIVLTIRFLTLEFGQKYYVFIWGAFLVRIGTGLFYAVKPLYLLATILPVGQEAKMTGFYDSTSQAFAWLPPLILPAIALLMCPGKLDEIIEESNTGVVENAVANNSLTHNKKEEDGEVVA